MLQRALYFVPAAFALVAAIWPGVAVAEPDRVVLIRHGEKPESGDNLSCQGEDRALRLPAVLHGKFGSPGHTYIPALGQGKSTHHARMFQTVTPFAVKYDLTLNSKFETDDYAGVADDVRKRSGTVLLVWEHKAIPHIAAALGVDDPPGWKGEDFDSIWVVTFPSGKAVLSFDKEGITPASACPF